MNRPEVREGRARGTARLFVYGTLRRGAGHPLAQRLARVARQEGRATCSGGLVVIRGSYPGLVEDSAGSVVGDVLVLDDPHAAFARLDPYEGCGPDDPPPHEYERVIRPVRREDATRVDAWVYVYRGDWKRWPVLAGGDWLAR